MWHVRDRWVLLLGAACGLLTVSLGGRTGGFTGTLYPLRPRDVVSTGAFLILFQGSFAAPLSKVAQFTVSAAFATRVALPSMAFAMWGRHELFVVHGRSLPSQFQEVIHNLKAVRPLRSSWL